MSYGTNRYKRQDGNNQKANEFIEYLQKKYKFNDDIREKLHRQMSKIGFSKGIIVEILRKILGI